MKHALLAFCLLFLLACAFMVNVKAYYSYTLVDGDVDISLTGANALKDEHPSDTTSSSAVGQALTANASYDVGYIQFYMKRNNQPTADLVCAVYNTTGLPGTTGKPDGTSALAYSDNLIDSATLTTSFVWRTFNFTESGLSFVNGVNYSISVEANTSNVDGTHYPLIGMDRNSGHMGNRFLYNSSGWNWYSNQLYDYLFRVYSFVEIDDINPTVDYLGFNSTLNGSVTEWTYNFSDNIGLSHFVHSWNNSGTMTNTTYAITGTQNQTTRTFTLNATDGEKIEYRIFVNDTSNNWDSMILQFFYTNTEPVIVSVGEGFLIMGVFFLVGVFGIIGYIAYSKH